MSALEDRLDRRSIVEQLLRVEPGNANYSMVALDERVRRVVNRLINAESSAKPTADDEARTQAESLIKDTLSSAEWAGVNLMVTFKKEVLLDAIASALTQSRQRAIEVVESFMTIHEEVVSNEDLVLNAKLREIVAALEGREG